MLGLAEFLFLFLLLFDYSVLGLQIDVNPLKTIAACERIDSVHILMRGLLHQGDHANLLRILQYPIYDFEPFYLEKVCPLLEPKNVQDILQNDSLRPEERKLLLSPACLAASPVLSTLDRSFAFLLPANPLRDDLLDLKAVKPSLLHELLLRSINEQSPLNASIVFKHFEDRLKTNDFMHNHGWRLVTEESFCAQSESVKRLLVHSCAAGIPQLTLSTSNQEWAESLQRVLVLLSMKRNLLKCSQEPLTVDINAFCERLVAYLDEMQSPQASVAKQILISILRLLNTYRIPVTNFLAASAHASIQLQPDWIAENLNFFSGDAQEFLRLIKEQVVPFRKENEQIMMKVRDFFKTRFGWRSLPMKVSQDSRSVQSKLRKTRMQSLPLAITHQRLDLPEGETAYERLTAAWQTFKRVEYYTNNAFQFLFFGSLAADGAKIVYDRRQVNHLIIIDFLMIPELYIEFYDFARIVPSPLCPVSLLKSLTVLMHQNALLRENPVIVIDRQYFNAALNGNESELLAQFFDFIPFFILTYCKLYLSDYTMLESPKFLHQLSEVLYLPVPGIVDGLDLSVLKDNFLAGAQGFASTLRDVFPANEYSVDELYSILFETNKRTT